MKDIKTKITVKNVKSLVKSAELSKNMKDSFVRTKDKAEEAQQSSHDTPHAYATDKATVKESKVAAQAAKVTAKACYYYESGSKKTNSATGYIDFCPYGVQHSTWVTFIQNAPYRSDLALTLYYNLLYNYK